MAALPAHLVATPVLERVDGEVGGVVLGAGATAAWVDLDGFVVAVTTREVPLLPNAVALSAGSGTLARPGLAPGAPARLLPGRIELGPLHLTWDPAAPPAWDPAVLVPAAAGPDDVTRRGTALREVLAAAPGAVDNRRQASPGPGYPPGRGPTYRRGAMDPARGPEQRRGAMDPARGLAAAIDPAGAVALELLFRAVRERDPGPAAAGARGLLGRGPGLTPEGDDLLAAVAGAVAVLGPVAGWDRTVVAAFLAALVARARERTTALSATLLELAARGRLAEPAGRLLDLGPDGEATCPAALARLERLGHGSGRAYAAGIAVATSLLATGPSAGRGAPGEAGTR